jgi:hypothetical protein
LFWIVSKPLFTLGLWASSMVLQTCKNIYKR